MAYGIHHTHTAYDIWHAAYIICHMAYGMLVQHTETGVWLTAYDIQHTTYNMWHPFHYVLSDAVEVQVCGQRVQSPSSCVCIPPFPTSLECAEECNFSYAVSTYCLTNKSLATAPEGICPLRASLSLQLFALRITHTQSLRASHDRYICDCIHDTILQLGWKKSAIYF